MPLVAATGFAQRLGARSRRLAELWSYLPVLNLVRCLVTDCRKMVSYLWEQMLGTYCIHGDVFVETASYLT